MVPKPILICFFRDFKYFTFPVVNYTSLFLKCGTKGTGGTETHSHRLPYKFQIYCETVNFSCAIVNFKTIIIVFFFG